LYSLSLSLSHTYRLFYVCVVLDPSVKHYDGKVDVYSYGISM